MICAHCKKKIKGKSELLFLLPDGTEVGLHKKCEKAYNGE